MMECSSIASMTGSVGLFDDEDDLNTSTTLRKAFLRIFTNSLAWWTAAAQIVLIFSLLISSITLHSKVILILPILEHQKRKTSLLMWSDVDLTPSVTLCVCLLKSECQPRRIARSAGHFLKHEINFEWFSTYLGTSDDVESCTRHCNTILSSLSRHFRKQCPKSNTIY